MKHFSYLFLVFVLFAVGVGSGIRGFHRPLL